MPVPCAASAAAEDVHTRIVAQSAMAKARTFGQGRLTERHEAPELAALHDHALAIVAESEEEHPPRFERFEHAGRAYWLSRRAGGRVSVLCVIGGLSLTSGLRGADFG